MNIAIGCDHGGFPLKQVVVEELKGLGHTIRDCGAYALIPDDDYPEYARTVGLALRRGEAERGILICGSGVGASIAASKMRGIRAALCHDTYSAHQGVEHDNMNVLCLGARVVADELVKELVRAFVGAKFIGAGKYLRRVNELLAIEREESEHV